MAQVTVRYRTELADTLGMREEQMEAETVREVLHHIKHTHGADAYKTAKAVLIVVNGVGIHLDRAYKTALHDGDVVSFLPLATGG